MPKGPTKRRPQTVARLLDAALAAFAENGFHVTTIEQVCARAGYTRGAFYSNFASMDELFFALFDQHAEREFAWLSGKLDKLADDGSIEQVFALLAEVTQEDADWFLISAEFTLYALRNPEAAAVLREHNERHRAGIARLIEYFLARSGRRTDRDLGEMARVFIAIRDGALAQSHAEPDRLPFGTLEQIYWPVLFRALTEPA
ncbi:TetR/AcrR family transcriptional regulator [Amycolatopsis sp. NPDC059657]|uniref:TetR/AcrR family transcriptional regulator n=1 Tax=Amycolatopsis sp. NPDC059657 TaxID=3346899 RepID=UPI0036706051